MGDLEKRLAEALQREAESQEQQMATSEILRAISMSPTDAQPVFEAIVRSGASLCHAPDVIILIAESDSLRVVASVGPVAASVQQSQLFQGGGLPLTRGSVSGRAFIDRRTVHVDDVGAMSDDEFPEGKVLQREYGGHGTTLAVPLLREDVSLGVITLLRNEVSPFTERQVTLLHTFADQAVIAIENVRLFKELEARNRDLTDSLEQQTATSEILRVISSSPTDTQPVFDAIAANAVRLCDAVNGLVIRFDGQLLHLAAHHNVAPERLDALERLYPGRANRGGVSGRVVLTHAVVHVEDVNADPEYTQPQATTVGYRTALGVPMLREGVAIGLILVARDRVAPFSTKQIALLQTFADQAVIAIENVRLFNELAASNRELAEKSHELEAASQHKSEFLANMSHELRTPLNAVIGFSEVLLQRMFGELNDKQDEYLKDIYASGQHLLSLINDILDLSKIEAGRMELEMTDFDFPTALDNALTLIRERAGRRGIALHLSIDERLGPVRADERKIRQVVLNVLSNAVKFTPEGGRIDVAAVPRDQVVEVSVSDTGVGIAPEDQEAVFEEFRQVGTAAKKVEGTGLGLALSRKFIELHGGRIWVQSQVGIGSTFTFTIPVQRADQVIE